MEYERGRFTCTICHSFSDQRSYSVANHICSVHQSDPPVSFHCGINGCTYVFTTDHSASYRTHVHSRHECYMQAAAPTFIPTIEEQDVEDGMETAGDDTSYATEPTEPARHHDFSLAVGEFVLKCLEKYKITQSSMNGIIEDLSSLWQKALVQMEEVLEANPGDVPSLLRSALPNELLQPFDRFKTEYRRQSFFCEAFDLLVNLSLLLTPSNYCF